MAFAAWAPVALHRCLTPEAQALVAFPRLTARRSVARRQALAVAPVSEQRRMNRPTAPLVVLSVARRFAR